MTKAKIYTWSACPFCIRAKQYLEEKGIEFEEIILDGKDDELRQLREQTGHRTVPQIFLDDQFIGGYSELIKLDL